MSRRALQAGLLPASDAFRWPVADIDQELLLTLSDRTVRPGNQYLLGGKPGSLSDDSATIACTPIDCSGYVRWILFRATGNQLVIPDGSWLQAEWAERVGLKQTTIDTGELRDGVVRLYQMRGIGPRGVGHIALVVDGRTIESRGKAGPDRRPWVEQKWRRRCRGWVLTPPRAVSRREKTAIV